jgi:hypothetical protein
MFLLFSPWFGLCYIWPNAVCTPFPWFGLNALRFSHLGAVWFRGWVFWIVVSPTTWLGVATFLFGWAPREVVRHSHFLVWFRGWGVDEWLWWPLWLKWWCYLFDQTFTQIDKWHIKIQYQLICVHIEATFSRSSISSSLFLWKNSVQFHLL